MLKQRIISALVLIVVFMYVVLFAQAWVFELTMLLITGLAAWEWGQFSSLNNWQRSAYTFFVVALAFFMFTNGDIGVIPWISIAFICWIFVIPFFIRTYALDTTWSMTPALVLMLGCLLLISFYLAMVFLYHYLDGVGILLFLAMIWTADTAAYFVGKHWGQRSLAPAISPGKTLEGMIGGVVIAMGFAVLIWQLSTRYLNILHISFGSFLGISLIAILYSVVGDLFESMLKRMVGMKDSGHLIPGHGGVLDRIDSWIPSMVMWTAGLFWLGGYVAS